MGAELDLFSLEALKLSCSEGASVYCGKVLIEDCKCHIHQMSEEYEEHVFIKYLCLILKTDRLHEVYFGN